MDKVPATEQIRFEQKTVAFTYFGLMNLSLQVPKEAMAYPSTATRPL
jgi:hypothetical protein